MNPLSIRRWMIFIVGMVWLSLTYVVYATFISTLISSWLIDPFYQHGFFVAALSVVLDTMSISIIWRASDLKDLFCLSRQDYLVAGFLFLSALFFFIWGATTHILFLGGLSFICWGLGLHVLVFSYRAWKKYVFPCVYLMTAIPLPYLNELSGYIQIVIAKTTGWIFTGLGYVMRVDGITLRLPLATLVIAPDCTGIKSWLVLFSLVIFFLYFFPLSLWKKMILVCAVFPIAMLSNVFRVFLLTLMAFHFGEHMALSWWHDFSGVMFYGLSLGTYYLLYKRF